MHQAACVAGRDGLAAVAGQLEDDGGWVVIIDMPQQSQYDFKRARLTNYIGLMDFPQWRTLKPEMVFQQVDNWVIRLLD